jgi:hypothetical protein
MFGFNPSTFSDPFDVNEPLGTDDRVRAKQKAETRILDSKLGGAATGMIAQNKAQDIMAKANASAQRSQQNASTFGNIMGAVGSIGSFGAAGGFGGGEAFKGLEGFGPVADGQAYGGFLDATAGTSGMGPLSNADVYGSFLKRK